MGNAHSFVQLFLSSGKGKIMMIIELLRRAMDEMVFNFMGSINWADYVKFMQVVFVTYLTVIGIHAVSGGD